MEPGKRDWNCCAREVALARCPPPVSLERKRTLRDLAESFVGAVLLLLVVRLVLGFSSSLEVVRLDERVEKIRSIILTYVVFFVININEGCNIF